VITELSTQTEPVTESGIELLEEMLSIPSPSTQERELGQWLVARLRAMGFAARRDDAGNVVAFWGSGPREVMLLGHWRRPSPPLRGSPPVPAAASPSSARSRKRAARAAPVIS
jgi:hypothetical protein